MLTCDEALEMISAALDGELSAHERRELDAHLADCPDCKTLFDELAGQSQLLRELDCQVPEDLAVRVLSRLPKWRAPLKFWRQMGAVAVSLALVLSLGALFITHGARFSSSGGILAGGSAQLRAPAGAADAESPQAALWSRASDSPAEDADQIMMAEATAEPEFAADASVFSAEAEAATGDGANPACTPIPASAEPPVPAPDLSAEPGKSAANGSAVPYRFVSRVLEVHDAYLLVEVTDNSGYDSLSAGSRLEVSTATLSDSACPALMPGEYAEIVFDGTVLQTDPGQVHTVFAINRQ